MSELYCVGQLEDSEVRVVDFNKEKETMPVPEAFAKFLLCNDFPQGRVSCITSSDVKKDDKMSCFPLVMASEVQDLASTLYKRKMGL
jgi:hypothetical protein